MILDLSLHVNEHNKISADVYAKHTNNSTNVYHRLAIPKKAQTKFVKGLC